MEENNTNMVRLWGYELGWLTSWAASFSIHQLNEGLQTALLIVGLISALFALRETWKKKKV